MIELSNSFNIIIIIIRNKSRFRKIYLFFFFCKRKKNTYIPTFIIFYLRLMLIVIIIIIILFKFGSRTHHIRPRLRNEYNTLYYLYCNNCMYKGIILLYSAIYTCTSSSSPLLAYIYLYIFRLMNIIGHTYYYNCTFIFFNKNKKIYLEYIVIFII